MSAFSDITAPDGPVGKFHLCALSRKGITKLTRKRWRAPGSRNRDESADDKVIFEAPKFAFGAAEVNPAHRFRSKGPSV